jgi:hypothetical protein
MRTFIDSYPRVTAILNEAVFTITAGDGRSAKQLLGAGRYGLVCEEALREFKWRRIHTSNEPTNVDLVVVEFDRRVEAWEVGWSLPKLGLELTTEEDALRFGAQFFKDETVPNEHPYVFIQKPKGQGYQHGTLMLGWDTQGRRVLGGRNAGDYWRYGPTCRFVARRPRKE